MPIEGELRVKVTWDGAKVRDVKVRSMRPHVIAGLVHGRSPDAAVDVIARVHAICSGAQSAVAASACDIARFGKVEVDALNGRERTVKLEAVQEHCTRLGLNWARALQDTPLVSMVRTVRAALSPLLSGACITRADYAVPDAAEARAAVENVALVAGTFLLGMSARAWLRLSDVSQVEAWADRGTVAPARWWRQLTRDATGLGTSCVGVMPVTSTEALQELIAPRLRLGDEFEKHPDWNGDVVETGPLARLQAHPLIASALSSYGNSVATRLLARLTELAALIVDDENAIPGRLRGFGDVGDGFASAHTARGLLVHRAVVRDDVVTDYAIVAPTEWNFHPRGAFAVGMQGLAAGDEPGLLRAAGVIAQSLDPCVACTVEVGHA